MKRFSDFYVHAMSMLYLYNARGIKIHVKTEFPMIKISISGICFNVIVKNLVTK